MGPRASYSRQELVGRSANALGSEDRALRKSPGSYAVGVIALY